MQDNAAPLPDFTRWPSFPFEGDMRIKRLADPVEVEPPRSGEDASECVACGTPDDAYIWVSERWRVRAMDRPTGLPVVLILECRSHLDMGDLPNLLAAELGVMTVRLERAIRSLDGVARVHVNRWGDGSAHLHMWFLARPYGRLQLRGTFLSLWDDILPVISEFEWRENLALVAAWLADFGGTANAEPPHIAWQSPSTIADPPTARLPNPRIPLPDEMTVESVRAPETDAGQQREPAGPTQAEEVVDEAEPTVATKAVDPTAASVTVDDTETADNAVDQADPTVESKAEENKAEDEAAESKATTEPAPATPNSTAEETPATPARIPGESDTEDLTVSRDRPIPMGSAPYSSNAPKE